MLIDIRHYTFQPGKMPEFFRLMADGRFEQQLRVYGDLVGYFHSETGTMNQIIQIWAYKDHAERDARRKAFMELPEFQGNLMQIAPLLAHQESQLARPVPFAPEPQPISRR